LTEEGNSFNDCKGRERNKKDSKRFGYSKTKFRGVRSPFKRGQIIKDRSVSKVKEKTKKIVSITTVVVPITL
jgi:hypothetical protein